MLLSASSQFYIWGNCDRERVSCLRSHSWRQGVGMGPGIRTLHLFNHSALLLSHQLGGQPAYARGTKPKSEWNKSEPWYQWTQVSLSRTPDVPEWKVDTKAQADSSGGQTNVLASVARSLMPVLLLTQQVTPGSCRQLPPAWGPPPKNVALPRVVIGCTLRPDDAVCNAVY